MKICIITWITYNNYGTQLQAYALQKCLESYGHEVTILSDLYIIKPWLLENTKKSETAKQRLLRRIKKCILHPIITLESRFASQSASTMPITTWMHTQKKIEDFKKENIRITDPIIPNNLCLLNNEYDLFICGSDQIWSVNDRDFNGYFYLDFVTQKKMAYGPSLGTDIIPEAKIPLIKKWLESFSAISVRERTVADNLSKVFEKNVEWVCDPTLLHDRFFWGNVASKTSINIEKPYLLCYFLEDKDWYFKYAEKLSNRFNLEIFLIPGNKKVSENPKSSNESIGIEDFLYLFEHATYILTDSYHGSIFSLLFEKSFLYLKRFHDGEHNSQNIRILSLYNYLHIENRIISDLDQFCDEILISDYQLINKKIQEFRLESRRFIEESL